MEPLNDLLDLSKLEAGRMSFQLAGGNLLQLVEEAVNSQEAALEEKGLRLTLAVPPGLDPSATCDAPRIGQMLRNLLSNAIKFSPPASGIEIRLFEEQLQVGRRATDRILEPALGVMVRDHGVVIPVDELETILNLMDVKMPVMDGLETCRQLRARERTRDLPVIFVSALASLEERLAGYQAGRDDHLTKPFEVEELLARIRLLLHHRESLELIRASARKAQRVALSAMTTAGEMGEVLGFLQESLTCASHQELADRLFERLAGQGLQGILLLVQNNAPRFHTRQAVFNPLEKSVLEHLKGRQRVMSFGSTTIFTATRVSLLIRNMPTDDEEGYGRLKDHLAMLIVGIDERVVTMDLALAQREKSLAQLVEGIKQTAAQVVAAQATLRVQSDERFSRMVQEIDEALLHMGVGLNDAQELALKAIVARAEAEINALHEEGLNLDQRLMTLLPPTTRG